MMAAMLMPAALGASIRPDSVAVNPFTPCMNSGTKAAAA